MPAVITPATSFVVIGTQYVVPKGEAPYYEITLGADLAADTPHVTLITRDQVVAARALLLEGTAARVTAAWHHARGPRWSRLVLESLT